MQVTITTIEEFAALLEQHTETLRAELNSPKPKPVYTEDEMVTLMQVSKKTLQTWRNQGKIGFSQVGRIIMYRWEDLEAFLEAFHNKPFHAFTRNRKSS